MAQGTGVAAYTRLGGKYYGTVYLYRTGAVRGAGAGAMRLALA